MTLNEDPIHFIEISTKYDPLPGWYFWDETWIFKYGPYDTREEAVEALENYCEDLL